MQRKTKRFFVTNVLFAFWRVGCGVRVNKSKSNIRLLMALDSHNDGYMSSTAHLIIKRKLYETIQSRYLNTKERLQLFLR